MKWQELKDYFHLTPKELDVDYDDWRSYPFLVWFMKEEKSHGCSAYECQKLYLIGENYLESTGSVVTYEQMLNAIAEMNEKELQEEVILILGGKEIKAHHTGFNGEFAVLNVDL